MDRQWGCLIFLNGRSEVIELPEKKFFPNFVKIEFQTITVKTKIKFS